MCNNKNKVAPVKKLTIPKLELLAAVLGTRMLMHLKENIPFNNATLWSDSQIVLNWLNSDKILPAFINNRVTEIKDRTSNYDWRYCPTDSNPADLLSRGISSDKFKESKLWMHGPDWITDSFKWPTWTIECHQILLTPTSDEVQSSTASGETLNQWSDVTIGIHHVIKINRYYSYQKLLRIVAYVLRFIQNCKTKNLQTGILTVSEIQMSSNLLIQNAQQRHFADILTDLYKKQTKISLVKQLKLYMDKEN